MATTKSSSTTKARAAPDKRLKAAIGIVMAEFDRQNEASKKAGEKDEAQREQIKELLDVGELRRVHDRLYEAQALCKVLHMTQYAEEHGIDLADDLETIGISDVSLIVLKMLADVHSILDEFEMGIGKQKAQKVAAQ